MRKSKVNSGSVNIKTFLFTDEKTSQIWICVTVQIKFRWEQDVIKNEFNQIDKNIMLNFVIKDISLKI